MPELTKTELFRQPYSNGKYIAGGILEGHPDDTVYLHFGRDGVEGGAEIFLRPDEAASIVWILGACLYSETLRMDIELHPDAQTPA